MEPWLHRFGDGHNKTTLEPIWRGKWILTTDKKIVNTVASSFKIYFLIQINESHSWDTEHMFVWMLIAYLCFFCCTLLARLLLCLRLGTARNFLKSQIIYQEMGKILSGFVYKGIHYIVPLLLNFCCIHLLIMPHWKSLVFLLILQKQHLLLEMQWDLR